MAEKPSFDEFYLALLHPTERARLGIVLEDDQVKLLVRDRVQSLSYYSMWEPDFSKQKKRRRPRGPVSGRRTIFGWFMLSVTVAAAMAVIYWVGRGIVSEVEDEGAIVYKVANWVVETSDLVLGAVTGIIGG